MEEETTKIPDLALSTVVQALLAYKDDKLPDGLIFDADIGVHYGCSLASNCSEAIRLNRIIREAGIDMKVLADLAKRGLDRAGTPPKIMKSSVNGKVTIHIMNTPVEVDLTKDISNALQYSLEEKRIEIDRIERDIESMGYSYWRAYQDRLIELQRKKSLEQLTFTYKELAHYGCLITGLNSEYYFYFPFDYNPRWLIRTGVRYELCDSDIVLIRTACYLEIPVSNLGKIYTPKIKRKDGRELIHYHGNQWDCWGVVPLPRTWNRTLKQLSDLTYSLQASGATINMNSLMASEPPGMPNVGDLLRRGKRIGREGERNESEVPTEEVQEVIPPERRPTIHWGRR